MDRARRGTLLALLLAAVLAAPAPAKDEASGAAKPSPEDRAKAREAFTEEALAIFKRMSDFLAGQQSFQLEAELGYDVLQSTGQMLEFGGTRAITVRRPNRIRVEARDRFGEEATLFFDGRQLSVDLEFEDAYVSVERPGSLDDVLDYLAEDLAIPAPLGELAHSDLYGEVKDQIVAGLYVGDAELGDRVCQQLAFTGTRVDLQLWVEQGDRPLPCRVVITYKNETGFPQFWANLDQWKLGVRARDDLFAFAPREGSEQIPIRTAAEHARERREGGR